MTAQVFGKLPAHGDFVARGLAAAAREALDAWLSASLADAREMHGSAFEERFDAALPWRCTGDGVAGAIAASQDGVGRRYPVMVVTRGEEADAARCEDLLYQAIGEGWDADALADAAGAMPAARIDRWFGPDGRSLDGAAPAGLVAEMLA